jgi:hypothetical protein
MSTQRIFTAAEAQKKYETLPSEIKNLLYSKELTSTIQRIGEKNKLHFDQMGILEVEVSNVLLGFTETRDFPQILAQSLSMDRAKADSIVQDVNDLIFTKIREAMKRMYEMGQEGPGVISSRPRAPLSTTIPIPAAPISEVPVPPKGALGSTPANDPAQTTSAVNNPALAKVDTVLTEPTVSKPAPSTIAKPTYNTDPYREIPE